MPKERLVNEIELTKDLINGLSNSKRPDRDEYKAQLEESLHSLSNSERQQEQALNKK